jgi:hypothetical protein
MRWAAHMAGMGEKRNEYGILVRKPKTTRKTRQRWEDNIKMDHKQTWDKVVWTGLIWLKIGTW